MANEISFSGTLRYAKSGASASQAISFLADQAGSKYEAGIQTVGTTEESLQKGDIGTIGYVAIRNTDATNYVQIGAAAGEYTVKLLPGKGVFLHIGGTGVFLKANTAACDIDYLAIEA